MAKTKKDPKTQAARLLEAARAARAKGNQFQRDMGQVTLQRQARKTGKGQVG
jgi:hypothetical protein